VGILELNIFVEISLGIASADFKQLATTYVGRWDLVHLRCANFMSCTLTERLALTLLELSDNFGTPDRRGVRLTVPARHTHLAELVDASRPRVTEHLIAFERAHMDCARRWAHGGKARATGKLPDGGPSDAPTEIHCQKSGVNPRGLPVLPTAHVFVRSHMVRPPM
jgi:hypothetical protein